MMNDSEKLELFHDTDKFLMAIPKNLKRGEEAIFVCPVCGGNAYAKRNDFNGNLFAKCECGLMLIS